jgi:hypothetical protein
MVRNVLSLMGIAIAVAGFGAFVFVGIKVWHVKAEVNRQARYLAAKAHSAADATDRAIAFVREVLEDAKKQVPRARTGATASARVNPLLRVTAMQASRELLGSVERAQGAVLAASDAVVVAESALDIASGGEYFEELDRLFGLSPEHIKQSRSTLVSISSELKHARGILGVAPENLTAEELNAVNAAIDQANGLTDQLSHVVRLARGRVDSAKRDVDLWAKYLAYGVTGLATLSAIGQLFLLRFCTRKLRHLPA